jgi:hypothetical protein
MALFKLRFIRAKDRLKSSEVFTREDALLNVKSSCMNHETI